MCRLAGEIAAGSDEERFEQAAHVAREVWRARYGQPIPEFDWRELVPPQNERLF